MKKVVDRGKRSKRLSEVKSVENISKNLQSFLEIFKVSGLHSFENMDTIH